MYTILTIYKYVYLFLNDQLFVDKVELDEENLVLYMKLNKCVLNKNLSCNLSEYIKPKLNIQNILNVYQLSTIYEISSLTQQTFNTIVCCFTMLVETHNFLLIDYTVLSKLLASSELHITSELEVFNAANGWLNFNSEERNKFAQMILLKVRLPLLSDAVLRCILNKTSCFTAIDDCVAIIEQNLESKELVIETKTNIFTTNRYCNQNMFNMIIFGGYFFRSGITNKNVVQVEGGNLSSLKHLSPMIKKRRLAKAVCIKGEVFVLGGHDDHNNPITAVEKYSFATEAWNVVTEFRNVRDTFCICAFMCKIFVIGGCEYNRTITNSCLNYDTKHNIWKMVARMNFARKDAACAVFKEKIVVSGGKDIHDNKIRRVESLAVKADEWSSMPDMINAKSGHSLIVVKAKLFVIGYELNSCEVFDETCGKFVLLKSAPENLNFYGVLVIGSKIIVVKPYSLLIDCYDVDKDEWATEQCDVSDGLLEFTCVKVPWF